MSDLEDIRRHHVPKQYDDGSLGGCVWCAYGPDDGWPCDTAIVLALLDEEQVLAFRLAVALREEDYGSDIWMPVVARREPTSRS